MTQAKSGSDGANAGKVLLKGGTACARPRGVGGVKFLFIYFFIFYKDCKVASEVSKETRFQRGSQALVSHIKEMGRLDSIPRPLGSSTR